MGRCAVVVSSQETPVARATLRRRGGGALATRDDEQATAEEAGPQGHSQHLSFAGHESFPLRYGWLKKCVDAVSGDPDFFTRDEAMVALGVGKNMVRAVRHWGLVARVIDEVPGTRGRSLTVSPLGRLLFAADGIDPYLEDPRTLWLLHWQLCTHPERATTWRWLFGVWGRDSFTREELRAAMVALAAGGRATPGTVGRDVDVCLRTYLPSRATRANPLEDTLDSPLVELHLLREDPVDDRVERVRGAKPALDDVVLAYAVLDHWARVAAHSESLHVDTLVHGESGPGRVFGFDERSLGERLEHAEAWSRGVLRYDQTVGFGSSDG